MELTKATKINNLIDRYPDMIPVLMSYGLHCVGCNFAKHDTLETGAKLHGFDEKTFEMMLKDLNKIASKIDNEKQGK